MNKISISTVRSYKDGVAFPTYCIYGVSKDSWKSHKSLAHRYYVGNEIYGSPLFKTPQLAQRAIELLHPWA